MLENAIGAGVRQQFHAVGNPLASAEEVTMTEVKSGNYEDSEMPCDVKPNLQMKVRVGVVRKLTGTGDQQRGKFLLLDVKNISGNKVLVLREPRLAGLTKYKEIDWPCSEEDIRNIQVSKVAGTAAATVAPAWGPAAPMEVETSAAPDASEHNGVSQSSRGFWRKLQLSDVRRINGSKVCRVCTPWLVVFISMFIFYFSPAQ